MILLPWWVWDFSNSIKENSDTDLTITANLSKVSGFDININFDISGTATINDEFTVNQSPLIIPAGESSGTITISTKDLDDNEVEEIETIILSITTIANGTSSTGEITISLYSDDNPTVSDISIDKDEISENGESVTISASLNKAASYDSYIPFTLSGSATQSSYNIPIGAEAAIDGDFKSSSIESIYVAGKSFEQGSKLDQLSEPRGIFITNNRDIYIADFENHRVMKWKAGSNEGVIVAGGNGNGSNTNQLSSPSDVSVDSDGNLYVLDRSNYRVMKWEPDANEGSVVAGGNGRGDGNEQIGNSNYFFVDVNQNIT